MADAATVEQQFSQLDANGDGVISREEFAAAMSGGQFLTAEPAAEQAYTYAAPPSYAAGMTYGGYASGYTCAAAPYAYGSPAVTYAATGAPQVMTYAAPAEYAAGTATTMATYAAGEYPAGALTYAAPPAYATYAPQMYAAQPYGVTVAGTDTLAHGAPYGAHYGAPYGASYGAPYATTHSGAITYGAPTAYAGGAVTYAAPPVTLAGHTMGYPGLTYAAAPAPWGAMMAAPQGAMTYGLQPAQIVQAEASTEYGQYDFQQAGAAPEAAAQVVEEFVGGEGGLPEAASMIAYPAQAEESAKITVLKAPPMKVTKSKNKRRGCC
eukprot:NODE_6538_length_1662_cov_32.015635.p1 GENE.NODE_6538_length_1662_cov_32.015635~~NODE_6538_length_1662_cov_32.015635.p1  ORF type:complete len:353 (+),score=70.85 NODE_6538_length_1662_cov_32.015635:91-1059(+)